MMMDGAYARMTQLVGTPVLLTVYKFLCVSVFCVLYHGWRHGWRRDLKKSVGVLVFLVYLTFVFNVTGIGTVWDFLRTPHFWQNRWIVTELFSFSTELTLFLNWVMTVPFGFLVPLIWEKSRSVVFVTSLGFLFSLMIEASQLLNQRSTMVDDLLMNTLGALLGYLLYALMFGWLHRNKHGFSLEPLVYVVLGFLGMFLFYDVELVWQLLRW